MLDCSQKTAVMKKEEKQASSVFEICFCRFISRINDDILFEIPHDEGENDNENLRSIIVSLYLHSDSIVAISL